MGLGRIGLSKLSDDMRDPSGAELLVFARVLLCFPPAEQAAIAKQILLDVEAADQHRQDLGRCSPTLGDGSLMARCHLMAPEPEPLAHDSRFLAALIVACETLLRHFKS